MSKETKQKLLKSALLAFGGALIAFIPEFYSIVDWGVYAPFVGGLAAFLVNTIKLSLPK